MLVLSRKKNQTVLIDGQIEIEVLKIKGNTVRLGITAPNNVKVLRGELSPFEVDLKASDLVGEARPRFETETLDPVPSSFAIAHVS